MEKTQEEIILDNFEFKLKLGEYKSYPFKSLGNVIHWLNALGLVQYDVVTVGDYKVNYHGEKVADFIFDEENQMPVFTFTKKWDWLQSTQDIYIKSLSNKK